MQTSKLQFVMSDASERMKGTRLPDLKDENFRYTPIGKPHLDFTTATEKEIDLSSFDKYFPTSRSCGKSVSLSDSSVSHASADLNIQTWQEASQSESFKSSELLPEGAFSSDIFALASVSSEFGGLRLTVPARTEMELPFDYLVFASQRVKNRLLVIVEEGASLKFRGLWSGESGAVDQQILAWQSFILRPGSCLEFVDLQRFPEKCRYFIRQEFHLDQSAKVDARWAASGGELGQYRVHVNEKGEGAEFRGRRSVVGRRKQHYDFWIENLHSAAHCLSSFEQWAVIDDVSKSVFNGMIRIPKNMSGSDALHKSRTMLLSSRASTENMPKLIIETDDVSVSHGASVSSIDDDQLYYLQSRGIAKEEARQILIEGFLESSWNELKDESFKDYLRTEFLGND